LSIGLVDNQFHQVDFMQKEGRDQARRSSGNLYPPDKVPMPAS